jgi:uncharacterized membrane protein YgdD (TMEM256/DUF423 family)
MAIPPALAAQRLGAVLALLGVCLGAFAAHGLKPTLLENGTWDVWQTAVLYQFIHALAMLALGQGTSLRTGPLVCWGIGVVMFSGSLYILAICPTWRWIGPVTPLGGAAFIVGWIWFLLSLRAPIKGQN